MKRINYAKSTYLLKCEKGYYWIYHPDENGKPCLNGPHSEKMVNLPEVKIANPLDFKPSKDWPVYIEDEEKVWRISE